MLSGKAKSMLVLLLAASMILSNDMAAAAAGMGQSVSQISAELPEADSISEDDAEPEDDTASGNETEPEDSFTPEEGVSENETPDSSVSQDTVSGDEAEEEIIVSDEDPLEEETVSAGEVSEGEVSGDEVHTADVSENAVTDEDSGATNGLMAPADVKAVINGKNKVVLTWKKVKGAAYYEVSRLNSEGTFSRVTTLSNTKYLDDVRYNGAQSFVYKVTAYGRDYSGIEGRGEPGYAVCAPKIVSVLPGSVSDNDMQCYMDVNFTTVKGAAEYKIYHSQKKRADSFQLAGTVSNLNGMKVSDYNGMLMEKYLDDGSSESGADYLLEHGDYYYYKVRAGVSINENYYESADSVVVKARVKMRAPKFYQITSVSYNKATLYWEDMPQVQGGSTYQIFVSTKPDKGYKRVKTVRRRDLDTVSYNQAGDTGLGLTIGGLKSDVVQYVKIRPVRNSLPGTFSEVLAVMPELEDVQNLIVKSKNYNKIKISFNEVPGAQKYYIYEVAGIDNEDGTVKPVTEWGSAGRIVCTNKAKDGIVTYTRTGLMNNTYYGYYVLPVRGKVHKTPLDQVESDWDYTRMGKTKVTAEAKNLTTIAVSWNQVQGATGYRLEISYDEEMTQTVSNGYQSLFYTKFDASPKTFNNRSVKFSNVPPGQKYYYRVTAYKFNRADYYNNNFGPEGDYSDVVCEWGRPSKVTDVKAGFHSAGKGASIKWKKSTEKNVGHYQIKRSIYKYDASKNKVGEQIGQTKILLDCTANNSGTTYNNGIFTYKDPGSIDNGTYVKYEVCGYYVAPGNTNEDQWIEGKYASVHYMNPTKVKVSTSKVTLAVGETITPTVSFVPKATTNKQVEWSVETYGGDDYVTVKSTTGQIKGIKKTKSDQPIIVRVQSRNDSEVFARISVTVTEKKETKGNLVVCLDPGHGGSDSGATYGNLVEKTINLQTSLYTKERLEQYGVEVHMTRSSDTYVNLSDRPAYAKSRGCNLFVSQHMNSGGGNGTEVYYSITQYGRKDLAAKISSKVSSSLGISNRGAKTRTGDNGDYYSVIRNAASAGIPGLIVEGAFLDGNANVAGNAKAIGYATAEAILEYYGYK